MPPSPFMLSRRESSMHRAPDAARPCLREGGRLGGDGASGSCPRRVPGRSHCAALSRAVQYEHSFAEEELTMEPRISIVTLGVADLQRSIGFYEQGLGWRRSSAGGDEIAFFHTRGVVL